MESWMDEPTELGHYTYITDSGRRFASYEDMIRACPEAVTDHDEPGNLHYTVE